MKSVIKKLTFPLLVGGLLWSGDARADANGDITSIKSDQANTTYTASGTTIDFKISLAGTFVLTNTYGGTVALMPEIRMVVNGDVAFATLYSMSQYTIAGGAIPRTDAIFRYTVKPGDMAQPLKIYGSTTIPYQFYWNSWEVRNAVTTSNAVWKFNSSLSFPSEGEVYDLDLAKANVTVKTLAFDETDSETAIPAKESNHDWRVTTVNPVTSTVVDFWVWTTATNTLQLGSVPNQTAILLSIPSGSTFVEFPIKGLVQGTADVYVQRVKDYQNNGTLGVTNYIKRSITITEPPAPWVQITMSETGTDNVTLNETNTLNTGKFKVELSEAYSNDVYVQVNLAPPGQTYVSFNTSPLVVLVPKNQTLSSEQNFNVPDGNVTSMWGVTLSPVITNALPAAYYLDKKIATVYVQNVKPNVTATYTPPVSRGVPATFYWNATDVAADMSTGMTVQWNFNGETITNLTGASGSLQYSFETTGTKTITVTATDKDGLPSDPYVFTVEVNLPVPKPSISVVPSATTYTETTTNSTGSLVVYLSESYAYDVWVQLTATLQGLSQSNIVFATTNAIRIATGSTNSAPLTFSIPDGTLESEIYGIDIVPTVTNSPANTRFTDLRQATVFVKNANPVITKPLARDVALPPLQEYTNVPLGRPFTFNYTVKDVDRDLSGMIVRWRFGDGTPDVVVTGAVGAVDHTYGSLGPKTVWLQALDKDNGYSDEIEFPVMVVPPPPPPTVRILPPAGPLLETSTPNTGAFTVQLTEAFSNVVTVSLTTTPVNDNVNGSIVLATNVVRFLVGDTEKEVKFSARDGTDVSWTTGFTVTPQVTGNAAATNYYVTVSPGVINLINVAPLFTYPTATTVATIPQGSPYSFLWAVTDVPADSTSSPTSTAMKVTWYFGDGNVQTVYGASGSVLHTYTATGVDIPVRVVATDKDGGQSEVTFKVTVKPSKQVIVTPIGPNVESDYYGAPRQSIGRADGTAGGIGDGMVFSSVAANNRNNVYFFTYNPGATMAVLEAVPYKVVPALGYYNVTNFNNAGSAVVDPTQILFDSFFFVWAGADQGLAESKLDPATTTSATTIGLPSATSDTESADIREVQAIFSREYLQTDNMGDINADGIPDKIANGIWASIGGDTATDGTASPNWLKPLNTYNDDLDKAGGTAVGDFLPINPTGIGGVFDFRPVADPNTGSGGLPVNAFIAYREVRGFERGLNRLGISDNDGNKDEPGTDPTLADTDGDGYPDGWEYWFWYYASFFNLTGSAYNAADVGQGTLIESKVIETAFQPNVAGADGDLDNDGLRNVEELTIGSNPIHWDTDGDGICDGWELIRTLNPLNPADGSTNPDGDYMAYATVQRQFVTVVTGGITTNTYLAEGASVATNSGTFTTWYKYGDSNAVFAVGRPVTLSAGALVVSAVETNALLLHFQVFHQFGFDPRTGWINTMNYRAEYTRFPNWINAAPNTKAFTSRDEYLLMKVMSEIRVNGNIGLVYPTLSDWQEFSTHPRTPDTDADPVSLANDGMPDGWELYVSIDRGLDMTVAANRVMVISPWNPLDGAEDHPVNNTPPRDGLVNRREFAGTESSAAYTNVALYATTNAPAWVTINRPAGDVTWINKFWPTNPWQPDTDGDGLNDSAERTFVYIPGTVPIQDNHGPCTQGAGLNPNATDTDWDAIPDHWESTFAGTQPNAAAMPAAGWSGIVISNGMDGTVYDAREDWDHDGLVNHQEYWVQAVRGFRYDITDEGTVNRFGVPGVPMNASYLPTMLFSPITNAWDLSLFPWGDKRPSLWVLLPLGKAKLYASTDPQNFDTDFDSMDDYYELYHGLNPILGDDIHTDLVIMVGADRIADAYMDGGFTIWYTGNDWNNSPYDMDFISYPWMVGLPQADVDADGLLNLEEQLLANAAAPANPNTDPTPLWLTDASNPFSLTWSYYWTDGMFFWPPAPVVPPTFIYNYEMNEGYDTDNDGISDKAELVDSRNAQSSPQDHDDPIRRQALWFSGLNSAASTVNMYANYNAGDAMSQLMVGDVEWSFRSFTVELWARPEVTNTAQVLIERAFYYGPSDASTPGLYVRRNFRIGIAADGRVYAGYDNAGADAHDPHTSTVMAYGNQMIPNQWVHIAARMSGREQTFTLIVDGEIRNVVETALVPANGVLILRDDPENNTRMVSSLSGSLVLGAANNAPVALNTDYWIWAQQWSDYDQFYRGYIDEVRIWDGARDNDAIRSDYKDKKRYTHDDLWDNRALVASEVARGYSRESSNPQQLSPLLLSHYTFDNLFGADSTNSVTTSPRGFMDAAVAVNRPADPFSDVNWWSGAAIRSTVYSNYAYLPWIENGYDHMPNFGGVTTNATSFVLLMTNTVSDSVYWTHTSSGATNDVNVFPNRCNPYGAFFNVGNGISYVSFSRDMLPLGDAFAKQAEVMWDGQGPAESWLETGVDSDSDGLADWWELDRYGDLTHGWNDLYTLDSLGLTNGQRYQRDIANGATEGNPAGGGMYVQTADSDGDGMPDWWEKMFNLRHDLASGREGAGGDPDRDGLSNLAEYWISEVYNFHYLSPLLPKTLPDQTVTDYYLKQNPLQNTLTFGAMFTDHDFIEDTWEDRYSPYYISRFTYDAHLDNDEDGWSNWSEARYLSDPSRNMHLDPEGRTAKDFPVPIIGARIAYDGIQPDAPLVINAYSTPTMDGLPDAVFSLPAPSATGASTTFTKSLGFWTPRIIKGYLSPGTIVPGTVRLTLTDVSTDSMGYTVDGAYDMFSDLTGLTGTIMGTDGSGWEVPIGTINYVTGEYNVDVSWFQGIVIVQLISPTEVASISPETSYMKIIYNASQVAGWPKTLYLSDADSGYVLEGTNYFFAFMDLDNSLTWDAGEPCGVPTPFATDVNWDLNNVSIQLTDYTPGYLRMTLEPGLRSEDIYYGTGGDATGGGGTDETTSLENRVRVRRTLVDGTTSYQMIVLDKTFNLRDYLHEGDSISQGGLGLDWGLAGVSTGLDRNLIVYDVYMGTATVLTNNTRVLSFTNRFDAVQAKAVSVSPINGAYVYSARPVFRWSMPEGYTAFALEIRKGSSTGPVIYQTGETQAPLRDIITGECIWEAPIHAKSKLPNGQIFAENTVYVWRVVPLNAKFTLSTSSSFAWSDWKAFRLDVNAPMASAGYGEIKTVVKYYGPATNVLSGRVKVQVFHTRGFTGVPAAQYTLTDTEVGYLVTPGTTNVNARMVGLSQSISAGDYYVCAYIDQNQNNVRDVWESWGYANYYGLTDKPFDVRPFKVAFSTQNQTATVIIEDADTDQDWFPDAWEYQKANGASTFLSDTGPSSSWDGVGDTEINANLQTSGTWWNLSIFSAFALGSTDQDGDGLDDMAELLLGANAVSVSTAGDGYTDSDKISLGLSPSDLLSLGVTGFGVNPAVANVQWQVSVRKDASVDRALLSTLTGVVTDGTVPYYIEFKASLDAPAWTAVETGRVTLDGTQALIDQVDRQAIEYSDKGFFRVRLGSLTE
jgi:hypothetical protein